MLERSSTTCVGSSGEKPGHRAQGVSIKFVHGNRDVGAKKTAVREDAQGAKGTEEDQEEHRRTEKYGDDDDDDDDDECSSLLRLGNRRGVAAAGRHLKKI